MEKPNEKELRKIAEEKEKQRRKEVQDKIAQQDAIAEEKSKYPRVERNDILGMKICVKCGNGFNIIKEDGKYIVTGRRKFEEKSCPCGKPLELTREDIDRATKPKKYLMWEGITGRDAPLQIKDFVFQPRTVYQVDPEMYEYLRHVHGMKEVDAISKTPPTLLERGKEEIMALSGIGLLI